jgi:hypothetical protein
MSSALRRPATRDAHTKYFIVLAEWDITSFPERNLIRSPKADATVTSIMTQNDFIAATSAPQGYIVPPTSSIQNTIYINRTFKDLGSVVHIYDQLGQPGSNILRTYRLVQLMNGIAIDSNNTLYTEGAYGTPSNFYGTYWICTQYAGTQPHPGVAPVARMG